MPEPLHKPLHEPLHEPLQQVRLLGELRELRGVSQERLAQRLNLTQSAISKLERRDDPSFQTLRAFVEVLGGTLHAELRFPGGTFDTSFDTGATDFAMAVGGGVDVRLSDNFSLRLIQVDYAPVFLKDRSIGRLGAAGAIVPFTLEGQRQDNIRISVGLTF